MKADVSQTGDYSRMSLSLLTSTTGEQVRLGYIQEENPRA